MIDKDFTLYEEALELKQLGFDEPCFAYYKDGRITGVNKWDREDWGFHVITNKDITSITSEIVIAPTYSQAFRWFREKHNIYAVPMPFSDKNAFYIQVSGKGALKFDYGTYEEAELACLRNLIEIVKESNKQHHESSNTSYL